MSETRDDLFVFVAKIENVDTGKVSNNYILVSDEPGLSEKEFWHRAVDTAIDDFDDGPYMLRKLSLLFGKVILVENDPT